MTGACPYLSIFFFFLFIHVCIHINLAKRVSRRGVFALSLFSLEGEEARAPKIEWRIVWGGFPEGGWAGSGKGYKTVCKRDN